MSKYKKQSHVIFKCDYHIVWVPKYRFRIVTGEVGILVQGEVGNLVQKDIRMLSDWLDYEVIELNVQVDHVHVVVSIPPKVSVSTHMGTIKGKLAIKLFKSYPMLKQKPIGVIIFGQGAIL
jgi:putative transposase